jgi:DNA-binding NarL/FixJ family response regulator
MPAPRLTFVPENWPISGDFPAMDTHSSVVSEQTSSPIGPMTGPLTVLLADDHPAVRAGVRAALEAGGLTICAEVGNAEDAVEAAVEHLPDVCLLDVRMPGGGIWAAKEISEQLEETIVVMLTVSSAQEELFEALRAGASGYLLKDMDPKRLPQLLRAAVAGEAPLPPTLVARLVDEFRTRGRRRFLALPERRSVELTSREYEVLELLRKGLSTADIAERLFISRTTVKRHISSVMQKLNVRTRADAVRLAGGSRI